MKQIVIRWVMELFFHFQFEIAEKILFPCSYTLAEDLLVIYGGSYLTIAIFKSNKPVTCKGINHLACRM